MHRFWVNLQDRGGAGNLFIDGKKTWAIKHWLEQTGPGALTEVLTALKDTPFQWGPWGETLSQVKFIFVGSVVNMSASPEALHGGFEEPTITVDWSLKLSEEAQANLFRRVRNHFEQATAIVDEQKEKKKYRLGEEDLLLIRNLMALWDQIKVFCKARLANFESYSHALVNTNHKDSDLREILDQRPCQFAMSMLPSARDAALKEVKAQEECATMEVEKQRHEVRAARWKFFKAGLEKDQSILLQLAGAPAKLEVLRHRKVMAWRLDQAKKGEKIVQAYMAKYLMTEFVEKVEHAQQKVNEFRAAVAARLQWAKNERARDTSDGIG